MVIFALNSGISCRTFPVEKRYIHGNTKDYATKSAAIFFSRKYQSSDHIIRKTAKIEEMMILDHSRPLQNKGILW